MSKRRRWKISLCDWPYRYTGNEAGRVDTAGLCDLAVEFGLGIELPPLADVPEVRRRGVGILAHLPELSSGEPGFRRGLCSAREVVESIVLPAYHDAIDAAAAGEKVIVFLGVLDAESDDDKERCVSYLKALATIAEKTGVILVLEHLNNLGEGEDDMKGHAGYRGHDLEWVAEIVREVGSNNVRLLFDIYHVEIMHPGRTLELLKANIDVIGHVHAAGVINGAPSRVELDAEGQQIDYKLLATTLTELGWDGGVGLEYIVDDNRSVRDGIKGSLAQLLS